MPTPVSSTPLVTDWIAELQAAVAPHRDRLLQHPVYSAVNSEIRMRRFMQSHVFAVWDFMSLLKSLQRRLTCVDLPWRPAADPNAARLVNEIVLAEETDEHPDGGYVSHLGLYLEAMSECGADADRFESFIELLEKGMPVAQALSSIQAEEPVQQFVLSTFETIESGDLIQIAASFLFGREDLIPEMFQRLADTLSQNEPERFRALRYYLDRHIVLDADDHAPKALRLIASLCGHDAERWNRALNGAIHAIRQRELLWDGVVAAIRQLP